MLLFPVPRDNEKDPENNALHHDADKVRVTIIEFIEPIHVNDLAQVVAGLRRGGNARWHYGAIKNTVSLQPVVSVGEKGEWCE